MAAIAPDVVGRRAATATEQVHHAALGELVDDSRSVVRRLVIFAERIRQPGVRVAGHEAVGYPGDLGKIGTHLGCTERAVEADEQRAGVPHGVPECLGHLPGQRAARSVGDRARDHHRPPSAALLEQRLDGEDRRLGVQRVEDRLDQEQVGATVDQPVRLFEIGVDELLIGDVASAGIVDVRRDGRGATGRPERASDKAWFVGIGGSAGITLEPGQPCRLAVELVAELLHAVIGQRDPLGVERVRLDDIGAGLEVRAVNAPNRVGLGECEQVVVAPDVAVPVGEPLATVFGFAERVLLDHRASRTVQDDDA